MHADASGAAFEGVARDPAIRAERIRDRLSMVARLRYGLQRLYKPINGRVAGSLWRSFNAAGPKPKNRKY